METYRICIEGEGLKLEREVPREVADRVLLLILTGREEPKAPADLRHPGSADASGGITGPPTRTSVSVREYLDDCRARRNPDKIAAIGTFLREHRAQETFTRADLERLFQEAAERVPKNLARDLKWAVRVGWIAPKPGERGAYFVTTRGSEVVHSKFPGSIVKTTRQVAATARGRLKKDGAKG
ncbi:MAG: hypothetical protein KatS3mg076_1344 [Candidatus Binatia bacterium]|nr:MAG: hypothetical protein KatS3mg076_1344 [Candidatus Binatia bacterium]